MGKGGSLTLKLSFPASLTIALPTTSTTAPKLGQIWVIIWGMAETRISHIDQLKLIVTTPIAVPIYENLAL